MHKNFIFDCGNVIRTWDLNELGLRFFDKEDVLKYLPIIHKDWAEMDGGMTEEEYYEKVKPLIPERIHQNFHNLLFHWIEDFPPLDGMEHVIDCLKENGRKVYMLSNMPHVFVEHLDMFPELKKFDGLVFSCDIRMVKPNKDIYEYILGKYSLDPKESIFFDDLKANTDAAISTGMDGFVFDRKNLEPFYTLLREEEKIIL